MRALSVRGMRVRARVCRSRVPPVPQRNEAGSSAQRDHLLGHRQGALRAFLSQAAHHGVPGLAPRQDLHTRLQ